MPQETHTRSEAHPDSLCQVLLMDSHGVLQTMDTPACRTVDLISLRQVPFLLMNIENIFQFQPSRPIPHSNSAHVSFLSPVESEVALPSFSSSEETSQDVYPSSLSPMYSSPSLPQKHSSPPQSLSLHTPNSVTHAATQRDDETLKLLQKHYMDAILTLTPQKKQNVSIGILHV